MSPLKMSRLRLSAAAGVLGSMCPSGIELPMAIPFGSTPLAADVGSTQVGRPWMVGICGDA